MILNENDMYCEKCCKCEKLYHEVYRVSDELWKKVTGFQGGEGLLCIECFTKKAFEKGIMIYWEGESNSFISENIAQKILSFLGLSKPTKRSNKTRQPKSYQQEITDVLNYICELSGKRYTSPGNIIQRIKDGYSVKDLKNVAYIKSHDPYFRKNNWQYFTPVTLYTKKNIEIYLKQRPQDFKTQPSLLDWANQKDKEINGTNKK